MFQYMKFERSEDDNEDVITHQHKDDDSDGRQHVSARQEKLREILHSKPIHITIIVLVVVDSILVVFELLIDLKVIHFAESNPLPSILHGFSIAILSLFMIEIGLKVYADYKHFIRHKVEVLDAIVVVVSFAVDISFVFFEDSEALAALGLLVLLRLWRVFRIINGIIVTVKSRADERVHEIKTKNMELEAALQEAENKVKEQQEEILKFQEMLKSKGIVVDCSQSSSSITVDQHMSASSVILTSQA